MPCQVYNDSEIAGMAHREANALAQKLCYLCGELTTRGTLEKVANPQILAWWEKHKESDEARVLAQMRDYWARSIPQDGLPSIIARHFIGEATRVHPVSGYHEEWFHSLAHRVCDELDATAKAKAAGLAKLSPEERKALGLKPRVRAH